VHARGGWGGGWPTADRGRRSSRIAITAISIRGCAAALQDGNVKNSVAGYQSTASGYPGSCARILGIAFGWHYFWWTRSAVDDKPDPCLDVFRMRKGPRYCLEKPEGVV